MNKTELIAAVAEKAEISKKDAEKAIKAFTDVVSEGLVKGEKIQMVLVHLRLQREQLEWEGIRRRKRLCLSPLPRLQSLRQARH